MTAAKLNRRKMRRHEDNKRTQPSRSVLNSSANGNVYLCTIIRLKKGVESERGTRSEGQARREENEGRGQDLR